MAITGTPAAFASASTTQAFRDGIQMNQGEGLREQGILLFHATGPT